MQQLSENQTQPTSPQAQSFINILENLHKYSGKSTTRLTVGALLLCLAYLAYDSSADKKIFDEALMAYSSFIFAGGYGATVAVEDLSYVMKELVKKLTLPSYNLQNTKLIGHSSRFFVGSTMFSLQCSVAYLFKLPSASYLTAFSTSFSLYGFTELIRKTVCSSIDLSPSQENAQSNLHRV